MCYSIIKSEPYKDHIIETKFKSNLSDDLKLEIRAEYFIDHRQIKFKDINTRCTRNYWN